jgi:adenylate cyclase
LVDRRPEGIIRPLAATRDWLTVVLLCLVRGGHMAETRKIAAILAADVVGFSRMASADEDGTQERLRTLHSELLDPAVASRNGRGSSAPATALREPDSERYKGQSQRRQLQHHDRPSQCRRDRWRLLLGGTIAVSNGG